MPKLRVCKIKLKLGRLSISMLAVLCAVGSVSPSIALSTRCPAGSHRALSGRTSTRGDFAKSGHAPGVAA